MLQASLAPAGFQPCSPGSRWLMRLLLCPACATHFSSVVQGSPLTSPSTSQAKLRHVFMTVFPRRQIALSPRPKLPLARIFGEPFVNRAAGSGQRTRRAPPAGLSEPFRGFSCPVDLISFLCPSGPPLRSPQQGGMTWHDIGNYDRGPEGKTNPSAGTGKFLSHFARREPWSPVRVKKAEEGRHGLRCLYVQLSSHTRGDVGLSSPQPTAQRWGLLTCLLTVHSTLAVSLVLGTQFLPSWSGLF